MPGPNVPYSHLDVHQILQQCFDESEDRLRVDASLTISSAIVEVAISDIDDSIKIGDGSGTYLDINPDGSINVVVTNNGSILTTQYFEITGIVQGITTLLASYSAVANRKLQKIEFSGTNIAEYELVIAGITQDKKRTYLGSSLNSSFDFNDGLVLTSGQLVEIYVVHYRPFVGDFNCRLQILET